MSIERDEIPAANPGTGTGANVNTHGVLTCCVQQPINDAINISWNDGATYKEQWKGPWAELKHVTAGSGTIFSAVWKVGSRRPELDNRWHWMINPPQTLNGYAWVIDTVTVSETTAGDHGLLDVEYKALPEWQIYDWGGYGSRLSGDDQSLSSAISSNLSANEPTTSMGDVENWSLTWGTYSLPVLQYCTKQPNQYDGSDFEDEIMAKADNVIQCAQYQKPRKRDVLKDSKLSSQVSAMQYMWVDYDTESEKKDIKILKNDKEKQIYNYYTRNIQPVFHYPIVTYRASYNQAWTAFQTSSRLSSLHPSGLPLNSLPINCSGTEIDHIVEDPYQDDVFCLCPFLNGLSGWQWLFDGCNVETTLKQGAVGLDYVLTYTWEGALSVDSNFYGDEPERWQPGGFVNNDVAE